jgi:hypothetical protein
LLEFANIPLYHEFMMNGFAGLKTPGIFTGLRKTNPNNYTQWINGAPLNYTSWDKNNPAAYNTENCVVF